MKTTTQLEQPQYTSLLDKIRWEWKSANCHPNQTRAWSDMQHFLRGIACASLFLTHDSELNDEIWELVYLAGERRVMEVAV